MSLWWCTGCGIVWADPEGPPVCRHGIHHPDPGAAAHPPRLMEALPSYHPFHPGNVSS